MRVTTHQMGSGGALPIARETGVRFIKIVEQFSDAALYKSAIPGVKIVGRTFYGPDWSVDASSNPVADADAVFAHLLPVSQRNPLIDYWEFVNEPVIKTTSQMDKFTVFALRFLDLCDANGIKAVIGNFPMGTPELPDDDRLSVLRRFTPVLKRIISGRHILGVHEYIYPDINVTLFDTWLQWRYRWWLKLCDEQSLDKSQLMIFVGECGVDNFSAVVDGVMYATRPWRTMWGSDAEAADKYVAGMARYEMGLRNDPQVVGAALFTSGTGASSTWDAYNLDGSAFPEKWIAWAKGNPENVSPPAPLPPAARALGMDVSKWQGVIDWRVPATQGVSFAIVRATQGTTIVDQFLVPNVVGATQGGLLVGVYHFFLPDTDGTAQANFFLQNYPSLGTRLPPALDLETAPKNASLFRSSVMAWINRVQAVLGVAPLIYTNNSFYNTWLKNLGLPARCPLWIANYTTAVAPIIPPEYSTWEMWQYTNKGSGSMYGVVAGGDVDLNYFNGTAAQLRSRYPVTIFVPAPPPSELARGLYTVTADVLNVRAQPMTNSSLYTPPVVGTLRRGEVVEVFDGVEVVGATAAWALISKAGNQWVSATYLSKNA